MRDSYKVVVQLLILILMSFLIKDYFSVLLSHHFENFKYSKNVNLEKIEICIFEKLLKSKKLEANVENVM